MNPDLESLSIADVKRIRVKRICDHRGFLAETYVRRRFAALGVEHDFVQENESLSRAAGTLRGLHFQVSPFAQTKLVRVVRGRIFDVAVDLRRSSPSYGRHVCLELSDASGDQLLVPRGFAHGFCTLEPDSLVLYKLDNFYSAGHERGIHFADPTLAIPWPIAAPDAVISQKDRALPQFRDLPAFFD
jgi:dTDP-4-dehydrorhamnose 3,5-epimerase